eukprot:10131431-Ditylum_brightwellii.AAC.1
MVYDASKSGLNDALWAPNFGSPTVDSISCMADSNSWFGDIDFGEMFHNYPLDVKIQPYMGIEVYKVDASRRRLRK